MFRMRVVLVLIIAASDKVIVMIGEDLAGRSRKLDYLPKQCNYSSNGERVSRDDAFRGMAMSAISKERKRGKRTEKILL